MERTITLGSNVLDEEHAKKFEYTISNYLKYKRLLIDFQTAANVAISEDKPLGYCFVIRTHSKSYIKKHYHISDSDCGVLVAEDMIWLIYPELYAYKPSMNKNGAYWFDRHDHTRREAILYKIKNKIWDGLNPVQRFFGWLL